MQPPQRVAAALGDEEVTTQIDLGGDDSITLTPTRLLLYRAEGLLSGESVTEYPLAAREVSMQRGRRKATVHFDLAEAGTAEIALPADAADAAITLDYEKGNVATTIVLTVEGRTERIKVPNEEILSVRKDVETAVCGFWDVETVPELRALHGVDDQRSSRAKVSFGDGPAPLELGIAEEGPAGIDRLPDGPTRAETDDIGAQLAEQTAAIEELSGLIEQLIDELRAGR
jgi:hypothetical protein